MSASRDVIILLEEGLRVLAAQLSQEDPERGGRGLMRSAGQAAYEKAWLARYAPDATPGEQARLLRYYGGGPWD